MLTVSDRAIQKAQELIGDEIKRIMQIVEQGNPYAIPDYSMFRYYSGQVHGLHVAEQFIKDAIEAASGEGAGTSQKVAA